MKKKDINLSIQNPCGENYDEFIKTPAGGFCLSCQKEVIDFSQMSNQQIIDTLKNSKSTCGRFREDQLGVIGSRYDKSSNWKFPYIAASFGLFSMLSFSNLFGQTEKKTDMRGNTAQKLENRGDASKSMDLIPEDQVDAQKINSNTTVQTIKDICLKGRVTDSYGEPLFGATVMVEGSVIGTSTDVDGNFKLDIKEYKGDQISLRTNYIGFDSHILKDIVVATDTVQLQDIELYQSCNMIKGEMILGAVVVERKLTPRSISRKLTSPIRRLYYKLVD